MQAVLVVKYCRMDFVPVQAIKLWSKENVLVLRARHWSTVTACSLKIKWYQTKLYLALAIKH